MKTRITWFIVGVVVTTVCWLCLWAYLWRPRDYTAHWPDDLRAWKGYTFLKRAHGVSTGPLLVLTPSSSGHEILAQIFLKGEDGKSEFPMILVRDLDGNGITDNILIADKSHRGLSLDDKDEDHSWDQIMYLMGTSSSSLTFVDKNMDGVFDLKLGPGQKKTIIKGYVEDF